jgi:hypothetical protein
VSDHEHATVLLGEIDQLFAFLGIAGQWFLDEDMLARGEELASYLVMGPAGRGDHGGIDPGFRYECAVVIDDARTGAEATAEQLRPPLVPVAENADVDLLDSAQVAQ